MNIPLMDISKQYKSIQSEIDKAIRSVLDTANFIGGPEKDNFEVEFAAAIGAKHCIGVGNGTDALFIALKAMGIGPGDEVITVANSFIATSEAVTAIGARVRFIDCNADNFLTDVSELAAALDKHSVKSGGKVKVFIPVHLYGQINNMTEIKTLCDSHGVRILEDCAQAHLAEASGKQVGTWGDAGTFSFYPGKNLGAFGDAGAIVTNNDDIALLARKLANHGRIKKYDHDMEGYNSRLDALQAAVLRVKLRHLRSWTRLRIEKAQYYSSKLSQQNHLTLPNTPSDGSHVFHLYVLRTEQRDQLLAHLNSKGIAASVHYPIILPTLKAYEYLGYKKEDFPHAYKAQGEILSLPLYPEITTAEMDYVISEINSFFKA